MWPLSSRTDINKTLKEREVVGQIEGHGISFTVIVHRYISLVMIEMPVINGDNNEYDNECLYQT